MEFKVNTKDLDKVLSQITPIIPTKTPLEIIQHLLLSVKDNQLKLEATDLNLSYSKTIPVFANGDFNIAVPGKLLHDTIGSLPDTDIRVIINDAEKKCIIQTETGKYSLGYIDPLDFPKFPAVTEKLSFKIAGEKLKSAFDLTEFACGKDEQRLAMRGILMDLKKDKVVFVSTDGHRLVKLTFEDFQPGYEMQIIIPARTAELLRKILEDEVVNVVVGEKLVKFEFNSGVFVSRLIDDTYPNYESVIPLDNDNVMKVKKDDFMRNLRRASYFIHSKIRRIDLTLSHDMLSLTAENPELGTLMNENMLCEYKGVEFKVAFRHDFISDAVEHIDSESVVFKFNTPIRPCLIEPSEQKENMNLLILVMPIRMNS